MNSTTAPVSILEEAEQRVARLGAKQELASMLAWVRNNVPNLRAIEVRPSSIRRPHTANLVVIMAYRTGDEEPTRTVPIEWDWACWKVQAIPLHICANFIMFSTFQPVPAV